MKQEKGERKTLNKRLAWILSGIVLGLSVLIAVLSIVRGHRTVVDLENYVNVGTDAGGNPAVLLDVDAILNDLRLPNPNRPGVNAKDYPEVYALCTAKMHLVPGADHFGFHPEQASGFQILFSGLGGKRPKPYARCCLPDAEKADRNKAAAQYHQRNGGITSMRTEEELLAQYTHSAEEFPVLAEQTHKVLRNGRIVNEKIGINENLMHYVRDTAQLISMIDGRLHAGVPYDHVIYLDKSARPVSWLVNLFWNDFAQKDKNGVPVKRPGHSYINIDRAPWFRNVGIRVDDDGRQKDNGELATYADFVSHIRNLTERHLAEIRALYVPGGIEEEDVGQIMRQPTILDAKRVLIVDEVSRTGSTLEIAKHLFRLALPDAAEISGTYFWNPSEPPLKIGSEFVLTSLPVWYDPSTLTGRGIGSPDPYYYRRQYEKYRTWEDGTRRAAVRKLRTHAFSASVFSAPLLDEHGGILDLAAEGKTRKLCGDLRRLHDAYRAGRVFFTPPVNWFGFEGVDIILRNQGVLLLSPDASREEQERIRRSPLFYLTFTEKLKNME